MKRFGIVLGMVAVLVAGGCSIVAPPVSPSPSGPVGTEVALDERTASITRLVENHARDEDFHGSILVAAGDDVLFTAGYGLADRANVVPNTPSTRFRIASISKQVTATAILMEQQRGSLSVDDPICEHLPPCPSAWGAITIRHLLTHTSGIPEYIDQPDFPGRHLPMTPAQIMGQVADDPLEFPPGSHFSYSNSGYSLLGIILETVSGVTYADYVETEIFGPLGMADSGYEHDGDGLAVGYTLNGVVARDIDMSVPYAAGALFSTVEDLHRWDRAVAGGRLVPATALTDGAVGAPANHSPYTYGFGVFVGESRDHRIVTHTGEIDGFVSYYAAYPDDGFSVVILSNREDWRVLGLADAIEGILLRG
jgi:CubicO group peptidase (beta-lactamase class C family)